MTIQSGAGSSIGITASAPATYNEAGYDALTFSNIGEVKSIGAFGREYVQIEHTPIDTRATKTLKGSYKEGSMTLELAFDPADAGQIVLRTASNSDANFFFRVQLQSGKQFYFPAQVSSFQVNPGSVDEIVSASVSLTITNVGGIGVVESA